jgi:hypothetical protein
MKLSLFKLCLLLAAALGTAVGCVPIPGKPLSGKHNLPPAQMLMHPGPGVGGPGPGVMLPAPGGIPGPVMAGPIVPKSSQVFFVGPMGLNIRWDASYPGAFDSPPLIAPGKQNFPQGAIYRLKLTDIAGRPGVELYPTVEIAPETPRTAAFLAHNPIPVQFTEEDFDQVATSNFVTKVIYVPDPEFQELAIAGIDMVISSRLPPGVDPIVEADRRGSILAVVRVGNIDLEIPSGEGAAIMDGQVTPVGYPGHPGVVHPAAAYDPRVLQALPAGCGPLYHDGVGPVPMAHTHIAGMTMPQYGMPTSGTPIGLPGPPHVPLGIPAGLQKHTIKNHTRMHLPKPVEHMKIAVKQEPGMSYPKPVSNVYIKERSFAPGLKFLNPFHNKLQGAAGDSPEMIPVHDGHAYPYHH